MWETLTYRKYLAKKINESVKGEKKDQELRTLQFSEARWLGASKGVQEKRAKEVKEKLGVMFKAAKWE